MKYVPRDYATIAAARQAAIRAGAPLVAKGRCHMCDWAVAKGALWCSTICAEEYVGECQVCTARAASVLSAT